MAYSAKQIEDMLRSPEIKTYILSYLETSVDFQSTIDPQLNQITVDNLTLSQQVLTDQLQAVSDALAAAKQKPLPPQSGGNT